MAEFGYELTERLKEVEADPYEREERFETHIELAAWAHVEFLRIHPYIDGNGRTARVLLNVLLKRFGYVPIQVRTEDGYFGLLRAALAGQPAGFLTMVFRLLDEAYLQLEQQIRVQERRARRRQRRHH